MVADVDGTHQVQLFMLTDGRPSDLPHDCYTSNDLLEKHCAPFEALLSNMETMVGADRFIFQAIGLGGAKGGEFGVLTRLISAVDFGKCVTVSLLLLRLLLLYYYYYYYYYYY